MEIPLQVRYILPEDIPKISEFIKKLPREEAKILLADIMERLEEKDYYLLVALKEERLLGFLGFKIEKTGISEILHLVVDPELRRKRVGTLLVLKYEIECRKKDIHKIFALVPKKRKDLIKFFFSVDFIPEATLRNHRLNMDQIVFSKFL